MYKTKNKAFITTERDITIEEVRIGKIVSQSLDNKKALVLVDIHGDHYYCGVNLNNGSIVSFITDE